MTKIIAEICQNHGGSRETLAQMIKSASENGADFVKIQSIFSEDLTLRKRFEEGKTDADGKVLTIKRPYTPEFERLSKLDLSLDDHKFFIEECKKHGVIPMTTIFSQSRIDEVANLPWPSRVVKVASYDCASFPFLEKLTDHFDHLIISTGATYDDEIAKAVELVKNKNKKLTLIHCVTSYPNTLDMANLRRMEWLRHFASEVGWSDHTLVARDGLIASKVAIYLGADYVERHFTILPVDKTKDGPISITPELIRELSDFRKKTKKEQLEEIMRECPNWESVLFGEPTREMTHTELLNRDYYRGRFASKVAERVVYNWEELKL